MLEAVLASACRAPRGMLAKLSAWKFHVEHGRASALEVIRQLERGRRPDDHVSNCRPGSQIWSVWNNRSHARVSPAYSARNAERVTRGGGLRSDVRAAKARSTAWTLARRFDVGNIVPIELCARLFDEECCVRRVSGACSTWNTARVEQRCRSGISRAAEVGPSGVRVPRGTQRGSSTVSL